jgi:hypothetical protein
VLKNISPRLLWLSFIAALAFQVTWYGLLWVSYVRDPQVLAEADFRAFYAAGRIARQEGFGQVYDLTLECRFQAEVAGRTLTDEELLTYNHPPFLLPVLWLLAHLDYSAAYIGYCLAQILLAVAGLSVFWKVSAAIRIQHIGLAVVTSLFVAPHLHYHDLALLAVPLVGLGIAGVTAGRLTVSRAAVLPMAVSVILLFSEFWDPARFTVPYLLMAVLPPLTWWYETR